MLKLPKRYDIRLKPDLFDRAIRPYIVSLRPWPKKDVPETQAAEATALPAAACLPCPGVGSLLTCMHARMHACAYVDGVLTHPLICSRVYAYTIMIQACHVYMHVHK